jgi:energy-converting hydrogenase Eha subunit E
MAQFVFQNHYPYIGAIMLVCGLIMLGVAQFKKASMDRALNLTFFVFGVCLVMIGAGILLLPPIWATARQA